MTSTTKTLDGRAVGALSPRDAAVYLGVSPKTMENWRASGDGPDFAKLGARVVYRIVDLDKFLAKRVVRA